MKNEITIEELKAQIGAEPVTSSWMMIDQSRIDQFADVTEDHQFIHIDEKRAKDETPFGGTIAHGFLTLSVLSAFTMEVSSNLIGTRMGINYGFDKIRFLSPVKSGSRVRAHFKTLEVMEKSPTNILVNTEVTVEIEGETRPALIAHWLGLTILEDKEKA
jgi:acyl dehydratase